MIAALPIVVFVAVLPILVLAFRTFDRLIILERTRYPEQWTADGEPSPFFNRPGYPRARRNRLASQKRNFAWLFVTPKWIQADADAKRLLISLRILVAAWTFGAVPLFALSAVLAVALGGS